MDLVLDKYISCKTKLNFVKLDGTESLITCYGRPSVKDLKLFKDEYKVNLVLTLQGESEHPELIKDGCNLQNLEWIHFPEMGAGKYTLKKIKKDLSEFMLKLYDRLINEKIVLFVHCAAGVHRTGVFIYGLLRMSGIEKKEAYLKLNEIRPVTYKGVGEERINDFEDEVVPLLINIKKTNSLVK